MKTTFKKMQQTRKKHPLLNEIYHTSLVIIGGILVALGLEAFLIPGGFLDGGITGISIILAKFINIPMGVFLAILNFPFIILAWRKLGRKSAIRTTIGVATLAVTTIFLHHMEPWTENYVLALFYGGTLVGFGIGIALRNGGALDGTETLATIISNKSPYSVDQLILAINIIIFTVAGFIMGWEAAMSSALLFYIVVSTIIDKIVNGSQDMKTATIITENPEKIAELVSNLTHRNITKSEHKGYKSGEGFTKNITHLRVAVTRLEEAELTEHVIESDPEAIILFNDISSLRGGAYENQNSH